VDAKPLEPILSPTNFTSTSRLVSQQTFAKKMKNLWAARYAFLMLFLMLLVMAVLIELATRYPWLLVIPVLIIPVSWPVYRIRRSMSLKRRGFFLIWGSSGASTYEEKTVDGSRKVPIPSSWTENGRAELFIPTRSDWGHTAPDWAAQRRDEIFRRVVSVWNGFEIHYPNDWLHESQQKLTGEQVSAPNDR